MTPLEPLLPTDPPAIGPYALRGRLGEGGMGAVYLGRSPGGRTVAVKLIRPELAADPGFRARFRAEVTAARAASGAFTAPLVDADPDGPVPWMATAYVPGVSLGRAVALNGPLPEPALRALVAGIAESLESVHAAGLTHRDLKPGNVLLALDGPHLIDFGIARATDATALTATGMILGTPAYMSPEQAFGQPLTPASDVFSLGSTLVFAARGAGPFDGDGGGQPQDVLRRVAHEEPDLSAVPEGLRLLVAACLAKAPGDRPTPRQVVDFVRKAGTPRTSEVWLPPALIAAIERAAAVMAPSVPAAALPPAVPAPPLPPLPPVPPSVPPYAPPGPADPGRRRLLTLGLAGGAVALAGGGTGFGLWLGRDDPSKPKPTTAAKAPAPARTDPARPLGDGFAAKPLWTKPVSEPLVQILGEGGTVVAFSAKHVWAFDRAGGRRWGPVAHLPDSAAGAIEGNIAAVSGGMAYAVVRRGAGELDKALRAIRLDTGAEAWTLPAPYKSPSGVGVAGALDGKVYVTGTAGSSRIDPKKGLQIIAGPMVWVVDTAKRTGWHSILTDTEVRYPQGRLFVPSSGTRLLWASKNTDGSAQTIAALDVRTRKFAWEQPSPGSTNDPMEGLTEGRYDHWTDGPHSSAGGLFLHVTDRVRAVDPANGHVAWTGPEVALRAVVASPDGRTVFAAARARTALSILVYAFDARTGSVRWAGTIPDDKGGLPVLQSADGTVYLAAGGRLWALDAGDGGVRWWYRFATTLQTGPPRAFWAGGGQVYVMGMDGLVALSAKGR
ncbi:protein kinase domain-containing protein [Streptomyces vietnamensis]|uniref:serine/threonine-protein kinase n=1 Tax=Streptomyces vietnamensis TaxID=362257 RepID=UPI0006973763|nr:serine/threonine-protein kinase [Streptomyces vietnamensis]